VAGGGLAGGKRTAADLGAWLIFEDESGQGLRPPKGRTWGRRGQTPVVTVTGAHNARVSLAALIAIKPGHRPRLIYRVHRSRPRGTDRRKGFTETDYARLLDGAHQQLGGPLVVIWDNLNTHISAAMSELIDARDWLTVFRLPPYAHELNPVELVWSHLKRSLANLAKRNLAQLIALARTRLTRMQYRPGLLDGFLASTGPDLTPFANPALKDCQSGGARAALQDAGGYSQLQAGGSVHDFRSFASLITAHSASPKMPGYARWSSASVRAPPFSPDGRGSRWTTWARASGPADDSILARTASRSIPIAASASWSRPANRTTPGPARRAISSSTSSSVAPQECRTARPGRGPGPG
jgi:hypothetical protein